MSPGLVLGSITDFAPPALLRAEDLWLVVWAEYCLSGLCKLFIFLFMTVFGEEKSSFGERPVCLMDSLRLEVIMAGVVVERGPPNSQAWGIFSHGSGIIWFFVMVVVVIDV